MEKVGRRLPAEETWRGVGGWHKTHRGGEAEICFVDSKGQRHVTTLREALFIPPYSQDTFSVEAATADGATAIFKQGQDVLIHTQDGARL